jgi:hypothetical protein
MNKQNKERIKDLERALTRAKYPKLPYVDSFLTNWQDNSANALTKSICGFLQMSGCQAERINTMGVYRKKYRTDGVAMGGQWTKGTGTPGSADISATIRGRSVKIEVKYGKDRQSEAQKVYQKMIEDAGGVYYISRTFDDFIEFYDNFIAELK